MKKEFLESAAVLTPSDILAAREHALRSQKMPPPSLALFSGVLATLSSCLYKVQNHAMMSCLIPEKNGQFAVLFKVKDDEDTANRTRMEAFLSDLSIVNMAETVKILPVQMMVKFSSRMDLFTTIQNFLGEEENEIYTLDDFTFGHAMQDAGDVKRLALEAEAACANEMYGNQLFMNVTPRAFYSREHYMANLAAARHVHLPISLEHLLQTVRQEEKLGRDPEAKSLVLGGYQ